jgi:hypothetical protein
MSTAYPDVVLGTGDGAEARDSTIDIFQKGYLALYKGRLILLSRIEMFSWCLLWTRC